MLSKILQPFLTNAMSITELFRSAKANSLVEYASHTRAEPTCLIENEISHLPEMQDIARTMLTIFSGYYLASVSISTNVGDINIIKQLDKVNPNRRITNSLGSPVDTLIAMEAYENGLPDPIKSRKLVLESADSDNSGGTTSGRNTIDLIKAADQLSVGKTLEVQFNSQGETRTIFVNTRLNVQLATSAALGNILAIGLVDNSIKERYHKWRAGDADMVKDLILCRDIYVNHRKALIADNTGYYAAARAANKANKISAILSQNPSVANYSSIFIISQETVNRLERETGYKLDRYDQREKIFGKTFAMMIAVVEPKWKDITIYHHSINRPTTVSFKDMKAIGKNGSGDEVNQVLEAYRIGDAPKF